MPNFRWPNKAVVTGLLRLRSNQHKAVVSIRFRVMSESHGVELISFENPSNPECRLFIPHIHWPAPGSESELAELLRERLLPHGLPHSVYVARCTPGEYGNKLDEDDADSLHFAFISLARSSFAPHVHFSLPLRGHAHIMYNICKGGEDNAVRGA